MRKKNITIVTLGCPKNIVDSEVLAGQLVSNGYRVNFNEQNPSEYVIINTCGFIGDAKSESVDTILYYLKLKETGNISKVYIMGCLVQRYRHELQQELPEADGFFGVTDFKKILEELSDEHRLLNSGNRRLSTPSHYAYLKISEGCDRSCSFCAIPAIRGKNRSRPMKSLITEALQLASAGVKELNIIAQDTTAYGTDIYGKRKLAALMEKLAKTEQFKWIRLHYAYPAGFPVDVLDVIRDYPAICKYIDLPLQHISDRILRSMKRGTPALQIRKLLEKIRTKIPGVALRTAFIVGYPGETRKEFRELLRFVQEQKFERMGVFEYSHEEGTAAYRLPDNIAPEVKKERAAELMAVQQEISYQKNQRLIGSTLTVLTERRENNYFVGRTEFDSPEIDNEVLFTAKHADIVPGNFYNIRITDAAEFDLFGEKV